MEDKTKVAIADAVKAAIDAVLDHPTAADDANESPNPHRFGYFKIPQDCRIKGFNKFLE